MTPAKGTQIQPRCPSCDAALKSVGLGTGAGAYFTTSCLADECAGIEESGARYFGPIVEPEREGRTVPPMPQSANIVNDALRGVIGELLGMDRGSIIPKHGKHSQVLHVAIQLISAQSAALTALEAQLEGQRDRYQAFLSLLDAVPANLQEVGGQLGLQDTGRLHISGPMVEMAKTRLVLAMVRARDKILASRQR